MAKKKQPKKKTKKRATKYDKKLLISGSLDEVLKVSVSAAKDKSKK
jgi:dsDNA-binding SOS-regulon protein